jgi:hypothetical protein
MQKELNLTVQCVERADTGKLRVMVQCECAEVMFFNLALTAEQADSIATKLVECASEARSKSIVIAKDLPKKGVLLL